MADIRIETEGLYDIDEALREIGIGYATLFRWIKKGRLTSVKIAGKNYFPQCEIDRLKRERNNQAAEG